ncbi:3'-5' exonuclease [Trichocoleus sp. FACHB-591]|uniref:3'-5' exonuclease n=1 Tax=Trichocoleus sp. FACHB-591 TaxID=2692872 RepID=UPI00168361F3|nr:3'-5' exonuclease [Trichocoleus sp. FACHB-591]MBD2098579.1 3'-5' exonuclease [Trichocoleus sp. FACHB-591]
MTTFVAIDFETADRGRGSACAVGLIRVENHQIVQRLHFLIRPPRRRFEFSHIHGITWPDVAQQPTFGELWPNITPLLQDADFIAAHNAPFDKGVLYACCDAYEIIKPQQNFICTVQLARCTWNIRPTKLPNVCQHLGIELEHHQALSDAEACARIVIAAHQPLEVSKSKTIISCPECQGQLRVAVGRAGQIRCPRCTAVFETQT